MRPVKQRYRRRKPPITLAKVHERIALDPPTGTEVIAQLMDDPYGEQRPATLTPRREHPDGRVSAGEWRAPGQEQVVVLRSIRHDPLGWMHSHGRLDEAQYLSGRHWQELYERSHLGSVQAVDTTKEPVDGGQVPDLLTDVQRNAIRSLALAEKTLGKAAGIDAVALVRDVLGRGMFVTQAAAARGEYSRRGISRLSDEFTAALSILATVFGYATEAVETRRGSSKTLA